MGDVTRLLERMNGGDAAAAHELMPLVYGELKAMARDRSRDPRATLGPTALVHEAWIRLAEGQPKAFENRRHFFAVAGKAMRAILVDRARAASAEKRGGPAARTDAAVESLSAPGDDAEVLCRVHEALEALHDADPELVQLVELRFFAGLSVEETAAALDLSERTVKREWRIARLWLARSLGGAR